MDRNPDRPGAPLAEGRSGAAAAAWGAFVNGLAAFGTLLIAVLMAIICADVVARNGLGASLPLVSELGALTLVMIVYLQLATTVRHDRLARTEVIFAAIRTRAPRAGAILGAVFDAAGAAALAVMAWATLRILERDMASGQFIGVTGVLTLPTWPFRALILLGLTVAALQFAIQVAAALARASGRGPAR